MNSRYLNDSFLDYQEIGTMTTVKTFSMGAESIEDQKHTSLGIENVTRVEFDKLINAVDTLVQGNPKPNDVTEYVHLREQIQTAGKNELLLPRVFTLYNQVTIRNINCVPGDSGKCIFVKCDNGRSGCIGMVIASHPNEGCIITPILPILRAFNML